MAEVLRRHWPEYQRQFAQQHSSFASARRAVPFCLPHAAPWAGKSIAARTAGRDHFVYHSCNHRACPQCGHADATEWIEQQKLKLLPVPYYLVTFTVPEAVARLAPLPPEDRLRALAAGKCRRLCRTWPREPKYLGAQLGCLSVLHTWGRHCNSILTSTAWCPPAACAPMACAGCAQRPGLFPAANSSWPPASATGSNSRSGKTIPHFAQIPSSGLEHRTGSSTWKPSAVAKPALKYLSAYVFRTALGTQRILRDEQDGFHLQIQGHRDQPGAPSVSRLWSSSDASCNMCCPKAFNAFVTTAGSVPPPRPAGNAFWPCWIGPHQHRRRLRLHPRRYVRIAELC